MNLKTWIKSSILLFILWICLSGRFEIRFIIYGLVTAATAGYIFAKINQTLNLKTGTFLVYLLWLLKEIIKSALDVTKIVISPGMKIQPQIIEFDYEYKNPAAQALLTNSIILTPGTVTIDIKDGKTFVVHALTDAAAEGLLEGTMQRKVAEVFGEVQQL